MRRCCAVDLAFSWCSLTTMGIKAASWPSRPWPATVVDQPHARAVCCYVEAADGALTYAMLRLARIYHEGLEATPPNDVAARCGASDLHVESIAVEGIRKSRSRKLFAVNGSNARCLYIAMESSSRFGTKCKLLICKESYKRMVPKGGIQIVIFLRGVSGLFDFP